MTIDWALADLPDLTDRTVVVTGGTRGIGLAVTERLRAAGATVLTGARAAAADDDSAVLDLADPASVATFAGWVGDRTDRVDLLVNNAAVSGVPFALSALGVERQFAVNHLGHAALTHRLLPLLEVAPAGRIVTVSSAMYAMLPGIDLASLATAEDYVPGVAYVRSKLANVLFATELDRRLRASGSPVRSLLADPGIAFTSMHEGYPDEQTTQMVQGMLADSGREALPASVGILYAATAPLGDLAADVMYGPTGGKEDPRVLEAPIAAVGLDAVGATALWDRTHELLAGASV